MLRDHVFQSNYCAGLQVLRIEPDYSLTRVGYFDNAPDCDTTIFSGSWSNYPFFGSGTTGAVVYGGSRVRPRPPPMALRAKLFWLWMWQCGQ